MNLVIHKYPLPTFPTVAEMSLPKGARFLSVANDGNRVPSVWVLVNLNESEYVTRRVVCAWTGSPIPGMPYNAHFLGTIWDEPSGLVCHYFDADLDA